jgi:CBS domain-containing protein
MSTNRLYQRQVKDMMSTDVVTVNAHDTVHEALELMLENKVSALPVVDHLGCCVGILSTRDFVDVTHDLDEGLYTMEHASEVWWDVFMRNLSESVGQQSVSDIMTEDVVFVTPDKNLVQAAAQMLRERVHRLPVLDDQRRLVGLLSSTDVLKAFVECAP